MFAIKRENGPLGVNAGDKKGKGNIYTCTCTHETDRQTDREMDRVIYRER